MGHGLGATRELRLDAYARRFAQAGIAALAFTHRGFGESAECRPPRQVLSLRRQIQNWEAALSYVKGQTAIDAARIGLWGSSFGGGHAITVARRHPELELTTRQRGVGAYLR
ncbi:MAG: alpha/beta hydrolase [Mycobacterium sp.]